MTVQPTAILARLPDVIATDLANELILLDPATGEMFSLNTTGRAIWQALDGRTTVADVSAAIGRAFDVSPERVDADVRQLLASLLEAGLVEVHGPIEHGRRA